MKMSSYNKMKTLIALTAIYKVMFNIFVICHSSHFFNENIDLLFPIITCITSFMKITIYSAIAWRRWTGKGEYLSLIRAGQITEILAILPRAITSYSSPDILQFNSDYDLLVEITIAVSTMVILELEVIYMERIAEDLNKLKGNNGTTDNN